MIWILVQLRIKKMIAFQCIIPWMWNEKQASNLINFSSGVENEQGIIGRTNDAVSV